MKHNRLIIALSLVGLAILTLMLFFTSPTEVGPFGVLLFFTTIYVVFFCAITYGMGVFYRIALRRKIFRGKDYLYAAIAAFCPIMILMARSFGAVNLWTISLIVFALFLVEFLVYKKV